MKKSCMRQERGNLVRKVRIIVSDPDATDDSSSDEWLELPKKAKRIVHEISLPSMVANSFLDRCHGGETSVKKAPWQSKKPVGVRLRQSGKCAAEISNPITKTKKWLGTFETPEEAGKAYADKKAEYEAALASSCPASSCPASGDLTKEVVFSDFDFSDLQIPDLSFLATEESSAVPGANGAEQDLDCLLLHEASDHLLDDFSLLDNDSDISGFENGVASELADFDFTDLELELGDLKFAFADQLGPPLNIACP